MIIIPGLPALWIFMKELLARFRKWAPPLSYEHYWSPKQTDCHDW
jgi:hypothetical protein